MSVRIEREEPIAVVRLERPERLNALSTDLLAQLLGALHALDADDAIRCIVLAGSENAFAAGADIDELAEEGVLERLHGRRNDRWDELRRVRTPLVAAVSGWCLGGGLELALACDLIVAAESARFGQPEVKLGLIPGGGGTQRLPRAAGKAKAMDLILSGRTIDGAEAERAGLVARVVPDGDWLEEAKRAAREIAARAPLAVKLAKEAVSRAFDTPLEAGLDLERKSFAVAFASEDAREGIAAFREKRDPVFKGR